jgi:hypothetical protein
MVVGEEGRILGLGNTYLVGLDQRDRHRSRNRRCTSPEGDRQARRDLWIAGEDPTVARSEKYQAFSCAVIANIRACPSCSATRSYSLR